jgi:hypothetical protein
MDIVKDPYLAQLRDGVGELKQLVDGEPNDQSVTQAWAAFSKVKEALGQLCPNHPEIPRHFR